MDLNCIHTDRNSKETHKKLEHAIEKGEIVLVENVDETLDPSIYSLLHK